MIEVHGGIRVKGMDLWLDATRKKDLAFISHAHADHIRSHGEIIASEKTSRLLHHGRDFDPWSGRANSCTTLRERR